MPKQWTGDTNSVFKNIGASNHTNHERAEYDYYATEPIAVEKLLKKETFAPYIWECCCGEKHISNVLTDAGYIVRNSDITAREQEDVEVLDFLQATSDDKHPDIITNPPYTLAIDFVEHALDISADGTKVAMLLKIQFLETKKRRELFKKYPPKRVLVFVSRTTCAFNGKFDNTKGALCYAWFIWEKGYNGDSVLDWID